MEYETLLYERTDHVVTLTYNRPEQHNAVEPDDERRATRRLAAVPRRRRRVRARDHRRGRDHVLRRLGPTGRRGARASSATTTLSASASTTVPGRVRLHPQGRHLQAGDRGGQRLRVRRRARDGAAGRHPDRLRERGVRCARAALEHRRRRRDDRAAAARRRLRAGDGADHHRPPDRRGGGARGSGSSTRSSRAGQALARAQELARQIAALPQGAIRSDKESILRGVGRTLEERLRIEAEQILSMFMRRDPHTLGAAAFKAGNLSPEWPHHGL